MNEKPSRSKDSLIADDLAAKQARVIFDAIWGELEAEVGRQNLRFPKSIILLGGAPGAGKGTQTRFIMQAQGFAGDPIVISSLLDSPEMKKIKDQGLMVGDREVIKLLMQKLIDPLYRDGALLDGFPRTRVQVEFLKLLVDRINDLHEEHQNTPMALEFRRPVIHVMVLYVEEKESIERQLKRGKEIEKHNQEVDQTGIGERLELRVTDLDEAAARNRYLVFKKQTWDALQSLQEIYHYHFVNAQGSIAEVEANILRELQYQSSLELEPRTYDMISAIPLASEIAENARIELVNRLDRYALEHAEIFKQVLDVIHERFLPIIRRHALAGHAIVNTEHPIFERPTALAMLIDVFAERGFHAVVDKNRYDFVERIDVETGAVERQTKYVYRIQIKFKGSEIRRG
ncbi:MAG: nucleoside monophosphate kinase [Pirellulaceae bacterium]|nr:nucleoside monophosphate kinase [Pirellulaceae bacterium]